MTGPYDWAAKSAVDWLLIRGAEGTGLLDSNPVGVAGFGLDFPPPPKGCGDLFRLYDIADDGPPKKMSQMSPLTIMLAPARYFVCCAKLFNLKKRERENKGLINTNHKMRSGSSPFIMVPNSF